MRNLYYVVCNIGVTNLPADATTTGMPSHYIIAANTPKQTKEIIEEGIRRGDNRVVFNFKHNVTKIGLTNKKKGVMFSWIC